MLAALAGRGGEKVGISRPRLVKRLESIYPMTIKLRWSLAALLPLSYALAQTPPAGRGPPGMGREAEALAEPFRGITANGSVQSGLFARRSTGVSTQPVKEAAVAFLAALTPEQRAATKFPVDDPEWRKWMNVHRYARQGVSFNEMSEAQREAAFGLLRASLSAKGLKLSQDIMKLNHTLGELNNNNFTEYGQWLYHITVMGEPSTEQPWGWQIDGHHLIINYFVLRDQVVMSPVFVGSEPVVARSGKFKGTVILQDEQNRGLAFFRSLDEGQRKKAVIEIEQDGKQQFDRGLQGQCRPRLCRPPGAALSGPQQQELLRLVELYIANMDDGHAKVKMEEVKAHLPATHFAWIGGDCRRQCILLQDSQPGRLDRV